MQKYLFAFVITVVLFQFSLKAQYKIGIQISLLSETDIYLGYHFGNEQFVIDTCHLDKSGIGVFTGKKSLPEGVYMIVLPNMTYFDILIAGGQTFAVKNDTLDLVNKLEITGNEQNQVYGKYQSFTSLKRREISDLTNRGKMKPDSAKIYDEKIEKLQTEMLNERNRIIRMYPASFFAHLLKSMSDPIIPPDLEKNNDPLTIMKRVEFLSHHYFDNYDFTDERLLYSPVLYKKITTYFGELVASEPDSVNTAIDFILMKSMQNIQVYKYVADLMMKLFDLTGDLSNDEAFVYLAKNYYLSELTPWASQLFLSKLKDHVKDLSPTLIGSLAPELRLSSIDKKEVVLNSLKSCFTIVVFWNPDCEHCTEYIADLKKLKQNYSDDVLQVYAVLAGDKPEMWNSYVQQNKLIWINVYDPTQKNDFIQTYKLYMTPRVFLLDKAKLILKKDVSVDIFKEYLDKEKVKVCN
jgi:thiol-disulfide isomerase/thioredoxin